MTALQRATPSDLAAEPFDVLVIGGGIYGAMAARDAALRGYRTALVERHDFGGGSSFNSLKIMHGGIRYVQHLDVARLRASARERAFWCRAAPDLVRPLDFVIPLFGLGTRGPAAFAAAAWLYTLLSTGLRGPGFGGSGIVGREEARRRFGRFAPEGIDGGGIWRDGQISDANRLQLAVVRAAVEAGALTSNHMTAEALLASGGRVHGAALVDRITGESREISARVVLNCTGEAAARLAAPVLPGEAQDRFPSFVRAMNLVLRRRIGPHALGIVGQEPSDAVIERGGRMYFLTPWRDITIAGTHETALRPVRGSAAEDDAVADFLAVLNRSCPELALGHEDVLHVYDGVIPADVDDDRSRRIRRKTRGALIDHAEDGTSGLISLVGVKYTTARMVAGRAVDLAAAQLGHGPKPSQAARRSLDAPLPQVASAEVDPEDADALRARVATALRAEMAVTVDDILWRRTTLGETGALAGPGGAALEARVTALAEPLGVRSIRASREPGESAGEGLRLKI